jgi:hypothetical protein
MFQNSSGDVYLPGNLHALQNYTVKKLCHFFLFILPNSKDQKVILAEVSMKQKNKSYLGTGSNLQLIYYGTVLYIMQIVMVSIFSVLRIRIRIHFDLLDPDPH